jgi:hypothetical protein
MTPASVEGMEWKEGEKSSFNNSPTTTSRPHTDDQEKVCFLSTCSYMAGRGKALQRLLVDRRAPDAETPARGSHMGLAVWRCGGEVT